MTERMKMAYEAARRILDREIPAEERAAMQQALDDTDLVVVQGCYDRVQDVLDVLELRYQLVPERAVGRLRLRPEQMLIVNCPGRLDRQGLAAVHRFVEEGGSLFTTDWALRHVLEPAFPGFVAYNERPTADEVVRIEVKDQASPFLEGVFHEGADPLWWLEGSSYPIKVLDEDRVRVLIASNEIGGKYGETPVAVTFEVGKGEVFHMISHYYLQRSETRTARHQQKWGAYAAEVGRPEAAACVSAAMADLSTAEVEAAHKSSRLMYNMLDRRQRRKV